MSGWQKLSRGIKTTRNGGRESNQATIKPTMNNNMADDKRQIAGIGLNGLFGTRITELLSDSYAFTNYSRETGFDLTNPSTMSALAQDPADVVLLLAAKTDVDGCEADKVLGEQGEAWKINVEGTRNVVAACQKNNKKLMYVSTDFVFNGEKEAGDGYTEEDTPDPINWYARTKYEGEKIVLNADIPYLILRPAYPYRSEFEKKKDFVRAIISRLASGQEVKGISDHYFTPTFIDDFAYALDTLLAKEQTGIFHVVGSETLTPYEAALQIAAVFGYDKSLIQPVTREAYFAGKAPRPFNLKLENAKIKQLGVSMQGFGGGLEEVKGQMSKAKGAS
jgi:dTDP-4-dehydrorhamnose reductase